MIAVANIDVKQQLSSSHIKRLSVTSNCPKFGEKIHISVNSIPIKTFTNSLFSSIDPIIFPKAKLQFNVPIVKVTFPPSFKLTVFHNISSYQQESNIHVENIPTYIYCDTIQDPNKNKSIYIVNLESNFFTTSLLSTVSADLLLFSLEKIKKTRINVSKIEKTLYVRL
jgi:hypothetical protein